MDSSHRLARLYAGGAIAAGVVGAIFVFGGIQSPVRAPLVLLATVIAPALAVSSLLRGLDPWARGVVAGTAAVVLNFGVATVLLLSGNWSIQVGYAVLALISGVIAVCGPRAGRAWSLPSRGSRRPAIELAPMAQVPSPGCRFGL